MHKPPSSSQEAIPPTPPPVHTHHRVSRLVTIGLLSLLILYLASRVTWQVVLQEIAHMNWWYILPASLFLLLGYAFCVIRWYAVLEKKQPLILSAASYFLGQLLNGIIFLRAGTATRWYTAAQESSSNPTKASLSVGMERSIDGVFQVVCFLLAIFLIPEYFFLQKPVLIALGTILFVLLIVLRLLNKFAPVIQAQGGEWLDTLLSRVIKRQETRERVFLQTKASVKIYFSRSMIIKLLVTSILAWCCFFCFHLLILVGMQQQFSVNTLLMISLVSLAIAPPSVFAQIGVYQTFVASALVLFGITADFGTAYAVLLQGVQFLWLIPFGLWGLKVTKLSFAQIQQSVHELKLQLPV